MSTHSFHPDVPCLECPARSTRDLEHQVEDQGLRTGMLEMLIQQMLRRIAALEGLARAPANQHAEEVN